MKVLPISLNTSLNSYPNRYKSNINFEGKTINGHFYTDKEYVDAMHYKAFGSVSVSDFADQYGFWDYFFTQKPDNHAKEVNKCIADIKIEESRAAEARAARQREFEREQARLQAQINSVVEQNQTREHTLNSYIEINDGDGLKNCNLSEENLEILKDDVLRPIAENILDKDVDNNIPNGVLIAGGDEAQNKKIITELARKILQDDFNTLFKEVEYINPEQLQELLTTIKNNASDEYKNSGKRMLIFIPEFDKIAKYPGTENYSPTLNSFLKVYLLSCAKNGCIILASAQDKDDIEPPFLINSARFKVVVDV